MKQRKLKKFISLGLLFSSGFFFGCADDEPANFNNPAVAPVAPISGSGVVYGTVSGTCGGAGQITLNLMNGNTAVYQTSTVINGTYEMHANPGTYTLVANHTSVCSAFQTITVTANQRTLANIQLNSGINGGNAVNPVPTNGLPQYPTQPYYPACPYGNWGCYPTYYPGGGTFFAGKPNIYVSGREGLRFKLSLKYKEGQNLLAAIPVHGPRGWIGSIHSDGIHVNRAIYPYLYYDFRGDADKLQTSSGFCTSKAKLIPKITEHLQSLRFQENEIADFKTYWKKRLPKAKRFCVYIQENNSIDNVVELNVEPKPEVFTRVWYVVIPMTDSSASQDYAKRWLKKPTTVVKTKANSTRKVASEKNFSVREWGVTFLIEPGEKNGGSTKTND